jgi:hypothetical protein
MDHSRMTNTRLLLVRFYPSHAKGGRNLRRQYDPRGTEAFYAQSLIDAEFSKTTFSSFSVALEYGAHASVHSIIGGENGDMSTQTSPNDPLFCINRVLI